ncbi:MAG TPA: MutL protein [Acholeplasmataceae bacterium]|nr:MutL protein [Acholeplasmataceae bacterium]
MKIYLMIDFGSTYTKLTAVDIEEGKLLGNSQFFTTVQTDIREGYHQALNRLYKIIDPEIKFSKTIACSSAAGGLKMAAIGLVEELTVEAAKRVCLGAGGKVDLVFSHHITKDEIKKIKDGNIDIILLAGGTDGGNQECVIYNAKMLGEAGISIPIVYAGNSKCHEDIRGIFSKYDINGYICENVMPKLNELNIGSAQSVIRDIFMTNIIEAKGIKKVEAEIDEVVFPTPHAVLKAAELLSKGYMHNEGLGDLVLVDVGGATTDIYSIGSGTPKRSDVILRGLEEPFAKRTVEGDLGVRYSAMGIVDSLSEEEIKLYHEKGYDLVNEAKLRSSQVDNIPETEHDVNVDRILAEISTDKAISRHDGKIEPVYTPIGTMYYQVGKDLSNVNYVIGTGGVLINAKNPKEILQKVSFTLQKPLELRPQNPTFMVDKEYILAAMGLLSLDHPEIALKIMKETITIIN